MTKGNIGLLDASTHGYTTLMRSHTASILSVGVSKSQGQLVTCSSDCTIRVWDLAQGTQVCNAVQVHMYVHVRRLHNMKLDHVHENVL